MQFRKRVNLGLVEGPLNYRSKLWKSLSASLFQPITRLSVYQDSTRTTLASVGDAVGALNSLTNSDVTTQATTSFKPQLLQSGAGNNYLSLDGVNDSLPLNIVLDGAWVADMENINYLTNSNTATNNTVVDYAGNTLTLSAGEIGWTGARLVKNLLQNSGFPSGKLTSGITAVGDLSTSTLSGFPGAVAFTTTTTTTYLYANRSLTVGNTYVFSFFVKMDGNLEPAPGGASLVASDDFRCVIGGQFGSVVGVQNTGNNIYRVFYKLTIATTNNNIGVIKYAANSTRTFVVSGYSLVDVTGYSNADIHEYLDSNTIYNAGVGGTKYFNTTLTYSLNTANAIISLIYTKLPAPPTIKVNAGDSLAISPKYTARTIVDYLGNTITLKAGEIGWNGARRVDNLVTNSEFEVAFSTWTGTGISLDTIAGFNAAALIVDNSILRWCYKSMALTIGKKYCFSFFIEINSQPTFGAASSNDCGLVISGAVAQPSFMEGIGNNLYRVHHIFVATTGVSANYGIVKYVNNKNSSFRVSGYQLVDITDITANDYYPEYVKSNAVHNAGVVGAKYFNSDIYKQPLLSPITPNTTGVFTALAYSPTTSAQSDRDKIDAYVQNQGVKL